MSGYIGVQPVPQTTQTRQGFTATAGQTSFGTSGYQAGFLDVYLNGVKLAAADYTATNGSDVVLSAGAAVNDILEIVAFESFTVSDGTFSGTTTIDTLTVTNDGAGSNLDADQLDGQHGAYYTGYTDTQLAALVDSSPAALNTLNELAAALGDDVNFSTTVNNSIATKLPLAGGTMTGALDVQGTVTADGLTVDTTDQVLINHSGDGGGIRIDSTNATNTSSLRFGDVADNYIGALEYNHSNDSMAMYVNNSTRLTIDSSGNVGIGTASPVALSGQTSLTINGTSVGRLDLQSTGTLFGNGTNLTLQGSYAKNVVIDGGTTAGIQFQVGSSEKMRIDSSGNVGIGTNSPTGAGTILHLNGSSTVADFHMTNTTSGVASTDGFIMRYSGLNAEFLNREAGASIFYTSATERMRITSDGNVAISKNLGVNKAISSSVALSVGSDAASTTSYGLEVCNNTSNTRFLVDGLGNSTFYGSDNSVTAKFTSSGNVGIGTSAPSFENGTGLEIRYAGGNGAHLKLTDNASGAGGTNGFDLYAFNTSGYIENYEAGATVFRNNGDESMRISSAGAVTMPHQPAFSVLPASMQQNLAPSGVVAVAFGTERFDIGSNFASNSFTAPVGGKYQLNVEIRLDNVDTGATYYHLYLITSNKTYHSIIQPKFTSDLAYMSISTSVLADMDASDGVYVAIYQAGGTQQTDISVDSNFSGYLVA